ncbi:MAG: helix-turn-helix domain-containing protein [Rhodobacteraceae bacterium]|nr:helix-turn-helix domain-containing protein [Paracoccaceae bacterium]MCP5340806.1 helix-turn-helix domain-containing protein [Paracoccaceae bacterium]
MTVVAENRPKLPAWLPHNARLYLRHTEEGRSIRELARSEGCHASTVLRKVRAYENLRDDPLVDEALDELGRLYRRATPEDWRPVPMRESHKPKEVHHMTAPIRSRSAEITDEATVNREARRILRRLCEVGSVLAVSSDLEKAAVLKGSVRLAVVERRIAQAFALKDWISARTHGRVATYEITSAGRTALKRMLAGDQGQRATGFAEAPSSFADQHRVWEERAISDAKGGTPRRMRFNLAESPLAVLARRKEKDGKPFLHPDLVVAGERLREDFELAQMGPRVAQNWDRFLTAGDRGSVAAGSRTGEGPSQARNRVAAALRDLGPGLGDMVLRCCCFLEGLEVAEKRMGWSARSGKIVLRIALMRLKRHYDEINGGQPPLIG